MKKLKGIITSAIRKRIEYLIMYEEVQSYDMIYINFLKDFKR